MFNSIQFNFIYIASSHNIHYLRALYIEGQDLNNVTVPTTSKEML